MKHKRMCEHHPDSMNHCPTTVEKCNCGEEIKGHIIISGMDPIPFTNMEMKIYDPPPDPVPAWPQPYFVRDQTITFQATITDEGRKLMDELVKKSSLDRPPK